jgi:hypothetical protein
MKFVRGFAKHRDRGPSHFRADPVSWQQNDGLLHFKDPNPENRSTLRRLQRNAANSLSGPR